MEFTINSLYTPSDLVLITRTKNYLFKNKLISLLLRILETAFLARSHIT
jgi:hypothetical protein